MNRFLCGLAALPFLAGVALAGQPAALSDTQMDQVTAGFDFTELEVQNTGWVGVGVNAPAPAPATGSAPFIVVTNYWYDPSVAACSTCMPPTVANQGAIAQQTAAGFGP